MLMSNNRKFTIKLLTLLRNEGHEEDSDFNNGFHKQKNTLANKCLGRKKMFWQMDSFRKRRNYEEYFLKVEP